MSKGIILLIVESNAHPNFVEQYEKQGFEVKIINSMRKAMIYLKNNQPKYIMCEFSYGYGNNYAGINLSNLDVLLHALRKYSPTTKVITFYHKEEFKFLQKLKKLFKIHAAFSYPVKPEQVVSIIK